MQHIGRSKTGNISGGSGAPVGSRHCHQKWVDHCQDLHRHRLATMGPTVKNNWDSRPGTASNMPTYPHLSNNAKKAQLYGDRQAERELENYILLAKLSKILQRDPPGDQGGPHGPAPPLTSLPPSSTLYSQARYIELKRIHGENLKIVQRIQAKRPIIQLDQFERDFEQSRKYKDMISMFSEQRVSRGSSVTPTPHNFADARPLTARDHRPRPSSASVNPARPPRPNSAGATLMRQRQLEKQLRPMLEQRQGGSGGGAASGGPTSVWSENNGVPEEEGEGAYSGQGAAGAEFLGAAN
ncbi:hypothetical protein T492DRAFT_838058 [Pavlovales sp. CCMP2436]|nr:hypothetical protein T492DRAFT_838058 [Pavlovales sp. CCMP2436]|mmetsp:Transcript_367/g.1049  ORF Transcript_367/g.1049 Transcript_367/m.1049 type:complete len:297 (-) Transcript_367:256-1146(-)